MATTSNILTLLKFYASKQKSPIVDYQEFAQYLKRYAQHHVDENSDLVVYLGTSEDVLREELSTLSVNHQIVMGRASNAKELIFVVPYFVEYYSIRYNEIERTLSIPFPSVSDLPKHVPLEILTKQPAADLIYSLLDKEELNDKNLYSIVFTKNVPAIMFPSNISVKTLIELALKKLQEMLKKEEYHDYFLKKLTISNPGKELSIKNFFTQFVHNPMDSLQVLKESGDTFYYWSQLFYFIKQDYTKLKDLTPEDVNILQSVAIAEVATSYLKTRASERQQKDGAFKNLDMLLAQPPYYFNMSDIVKFKDPNGNYLLGQYTDADLKAYLTEASSVSTGTELPRLLIFKMNDDEGYFIFKDKVMPLIIRLCSDARVNIKESLAKMWYKYLLEFETLPEMKDANAFERCLQREVRSSDPILYALLNASFLPVISYEDNTPGRLTLFRNDTLIPYSELLMISRQEMLSDAKIKLPFYYSMPIISWILSLIFRKPKKKQKKDSLVAATSVTHAEQLAEEEEKQLRRDMEDTSDPKLSRKKALRKAASDAEKHFIPETSTLDRELNAYKREWNNRIGQEVSDNLTEDVNALIRDYIRKVLRTLKTENFNEERISSLAQSLVDSPAMMKIQNHGALKRYVELYIIKLIKNIP